MYELAMHLKMMTDRPRFDAYSAAIAAVVRPGDAVLDLGAGAGVLSMLALEAGARHVYAVELSEAVEVARQVARENGLGDRITCLQGDITRLDLPERVDVIVSDIRGTIPVFENNLEVLAGSRDRFLKPGGTLVPRADTIFMAPVDCEKGYANVSGWRTSIAGVDYSSVARLTANTWGREPFGADALVAPGQAVARLDYLELRSFDLEWRAGYTVEREGTCNGLGLWFEAELAPGTTMSTAPERGETVYGQAYFPFLRAHEVAPGDTVEAHVRARYVGRRHVWFWGARIERPGREAAEERLSTFEGEVVNPDALRRRAAEHIPALGDDGRVERFVLARMDGAASVGEIARALQAEMPERFATWEQAVARVGELSARHGR